MSELVIREDINGVAWLTLNRPDKLNALNVALFRELEAHIDAIAGQEDTVGCVVVKGGGKCFSAGHDLKDIEAGEKLPRPNFQSHIIEKLANLSQPVISAVHSHCYTGALELALAGDLILASENGKFADTHAKWALTPVWGMSQRLPRKVGKSKAAEMMLTARTYPASEAAAMGLVNVVFPDDSFEADVRQFCEAMLENSWYSLRANKRLLRHTDGLSLDAGLAHEIYYSEGRGPDMEARIGNFGKK
ncbi:MAG: enoyl-CoA hydratase/isomerase family protein [Pseudomonadales bacterium]|nr:enoyl-CoA hydratase/isomerase family protein [Pseudomonadales bacterium]